MIQLHSRPASRIPGDTARTLTRPATDAAGRVWPKGTVYQPLSGGLDNSLPGTPEYAMVTIGRERVTFLGSRS